jgi:type IV fimbrial biogenesis protein FimT
MLHRTAPTPATTARRGGGPAHEGFTLVELLVVFAIGALLLTVAAPAYGDWVAAYQLRNHAEQLAASMSRARSEAIRRGSRVNLCPAADLRRCAEAGGWSAGWLVYVDANRDGRIDDDEPVLRVERPAIPGISVQGNRPVESYVSFTSLGSARLLNGGLQMGTFTLCRPGQQALKVVLANSGRVRLDRSNDPCPA